MLLVNNTQTSDGISFKRISPKVMKHYGKFHSSVRESIGRYYNTLKNSEIVDLVMVGDEIGIKIKKPIDMGFDTLEANQEVTLKNACIRIKDNSVIVIKNANIDGEEGRGFGLDFVHSQIAEDLLKKLKVKKDGDTFFSQAPALGALLDSFYKMQAPLEKIKNIIRSTIK